MSYWIDLVDREGSLVVVDRFTEGGTYALGGSVEASLNVTYNYSTHFDFRSLHGRKAGETVTEIADAVARLGTDRAADYWKPTPGNAGYALSILLGWAVNHPAATWEVN